MAITVTFRGNSSDDYTTGATEKAVTVLGILPNLYPVNDVADMGDGTKRRRGGARYAYSVRCLPFAVGDADDSNLPQDHGDLNALQELLTYNEYLWVYSVSGASRVDASDADFWSTHSLPVSVTLIGDPRATANFNGNMSFEFDLEARSPRFS